MDPEQEDEDGEVQVEAVLMCICYSMPALIMMVEWVVKCVVLD